MSPDQGNRLDVKIDDEDGNDPRLLTVEVSGAPHGWPVFLLHGTPGSRRGPKPRSSVLYRLGVRLISYDRPGYGGSTRQPGRKVAQAAADVRAIAARLEINQFSVVGRSGGGPHALACAALLPDLILRTAVLVSVAPSYAAGLNWFSGMTSDNVDEYTAADTDAVRLTERLRVRAARAADDPFTLLEFLRAQMTDADKQVVNDMTMQRVLTDSYLEALSAGPFGWIDDVFAIRDDWGFDLKSIGTPVRLWHGVDDNFSPVSHTRWLAEQIPGAEIQLQADTAHFGAMEVLPSILRWLARSTGPTSPPNGTGRVNVSDAATLAALEGTRA